jgi:hypothetical protein
MASRRQVKRENDGFCADDHDAVLVPLVVKDEEEDDLETAAAAVRNAALLSQEEQWQTPALRELNSEIFCSYDPEKVRALSRQAACRIQERKIKGLLQTILRGGGLGRDDSTLPSPAEEAGRYYGLGSKPQPPTLSAAQQKAEKRKLFLAFWAAFAVALLLPSVWILVCCVGAVLVATVLTCPFACYSTNKVPDYLQDGDGTLMTPETLQYILGNNRLPQEEPFSS